MVCRLYGYHTFARKFQGSHCYNRALRMLFALIHRFGLPEGQNWRELLMEWRGDSFRFLHEDAPKILLILIIALLVIRIVHTLTRGMVALRTRRLPPGLRGQQVQTLASVINSVASFVVWFLVALTVLDRVGINLGPLLASAGIAGLAIGFGAPLHEKFAPILSFRQAKPMNECK